MCLAEIRAASSSSAGLPEPQSGEKLLVALEPRADQDAGLVWIADHFLHDAIAALAVGVGDPHSEGILCTRGGTGYSPGTSASCAWPIARRRRRSSLPQSKMTF